MKIEHCLEDQVKLVIRSRIYVPTMIVPVRVCTQIDRPKEPAFRARSPGKMEIRRSELQPEPVENRCTLNIIINIMNAVMYEVSGKNVISQVEIHTADNVVMDIPRID